MLIIMYHNWVVLKGGVVITQSTTNAVNNHYRPVLTDTNTI